MAKGIKSITRTVAFHNATALASGSNLILTQADMGTSRNGLLILSVNYTTNPILDLHVASSYATGLSVTTLNVASDNCTIVQDTVNSTGTVTIASKKISSIAVDGIYVFNVHDIRRYTNLQYTSAGTGTVISAILIGTDGEQVPYAAATAGY